MDSSSKTVSVATGSLDGARPLSVRRAQRAGRNRNRKVKKENKTSVKKQRAHCADSDAPERISRTVDKGENAVERNAILLELLTKSQRHYPLFPAPPAHASTQQRMVGNPTFRTRNL